MLDAGFYWTFNFTLIKFVLAIFKPTGLSAIDYFQRRWFPIQMCVVFINSTKTTSTCNCQHIGSFRMGEYKSECKLSHVILFLKMCLPHPRAGPPSAPDPNRQSNRPRSLNRTIVGSTCPKCRVSRVVQRARTHGSWWLDARPVIRSHLREPNKHHLS